MGKLVRLIMSRVPGIMGVVVISVVSVLAVVALYLALVYVVIRMFGPMVAAILAGTG